MSTPAISIGCTQRFDVTVTRPLIDMLTKLSTTHYDGVCKDAAAPGGFIYGWNNRMSFIESDGERLTFFVEPLTNRQLQTCLKICENSLPLSQESTILRREFSRMGFAALRQADSDKRFSEAIPVEARP